MEYIIASFKITIQKRVLPMLGQTRKSLATERMVGWMDGWMDGRMDGWWRLERRPLQTDPQLRQPYLCWWQCKDVSPLMLNGCEDFAKTTTTLALPCLCPCLARTEIIYIYSD